MRGQPRLSQEKFGLRKIRAVFSTTLVTSNWLHRKKTTPAHRAERQFVRLFQQPAVRASEPGRRGLRHHVNQLHLPDDPAARQVLGNVHSEMRRDLDDSTSAGFTLEGLSALPGAVKNCRK